MSPKKETLIMELGSQGVREVGHQRVRGASESQGVRESEESKKRLKRGSRGAQDRLKIGSRGTQERIKKG